MHTVRIPLSAAFLVLFSSVSTAQLNITEVGHLDYQALRSSDLSNLWGYVDEEGNEYALVGVNGANGQNNTGGFSIVDVTDPADPQEVFFTSGPNSIWREIKTYGDHAYITTEAEGGLMIVDLSPLPQSTDLPVTIFQGDGWITSHSLFIDETIGRLYINGANRGNGGCILYDLTQDPMAPVEVGEFDTWYVHDCYARGGLLYAAHILDGFLSIVDVSDPASPVLLGTQHTPNNFTHNCWLDDTGNFLYTTDEKPNSYVASYNVSDPSDIQFLDKLQTAPGSTAIVHNTYWLNGYVVQSYYTEGVSIYDVTQPDNMVEVGHYDTSPFTGDGFNGAWGVYPYLPSGNLLVSDIEGGLFILAPTYVQACWLEGMITDAQDGDPVNQATLTITGTTASGTTGFTGSYSTGWAVAGTYEVAVSAPGYEPTTVTGVVLQNGQTTLLDVELVPLPSFSLGGTVMEQGTGAPVEGANVVFANPTYTFTATSAADGTFNIPVVYEGSYTMTAGKWGWHTVCLAAASYTEANTGIAIELPAGYADDFAMDLGWATEGNASRGAWERADPVGTSFQGAACAPGADVTGDCFGLAYVTGNGGGQAGDDDVDEGDVVLISPEFDLSALPDAWIRYHRWFFNGGGNSGPDDTLVIALVNATDTVAMETVTADDAGAHTWQLRQFAVADLIAMDQPMRLIVRTADLGDGHLVEAGLDRFEILPASPFLGVPAPRVTQGLTVMPDPSEGRFRMELDRAADGMAQLLDLQGRPVQGVERVQAGRASFEVVAAPGMYVLRVALNDGTVLSRRITLR